MAAKPATRPKSSENKTPREAQRLIDFLNSRPRGKQPDGLASPESATRVVEKLGIEAVPVDALGLERLRRLRDALTALADRERNERGRSRAWDVVNEIAAAVPTTVRFASDEESSLTPAGTGVDAVIGSLIADLHRSVESGHWRRVRLCAYEPCSGAFYDATRSRTQRWHSYAECGNRANVAAYRRRAATASS
jgi:predicted RNA-binding Zn ribbon-like protein